MQIYNILQTLIRKWWVIALTGLFALSLALFVSFRSTPLFRTSSRYVVSPGPSLLAGDQRDLVSSITALDRRSIIATYAEIMNSGHIFEQAGTQLGLSAEELKDYELTAVVLPEAHALEIFVEGPNPYIAATLANTAGDRAIAQIQTLYQVYSVSLLDSASEPKNPLSPNPSRDAGAALILGLLAGVAIALGSEYIGEALSIARRLAGGDSEGYKKLNIKQFWNRQVLDSKETVT